MDTAIIGKIVVTLFLMYVCALILKLVVDIIDYALYVKKTRKAMRFTEEQVADIKWYERWIAAFVGFMFYVHVVKKKNS